MPARIFCTVVTWSHLPYVQALRDSLRASGNPEPFHVLVLDAVAADKLADADLVLSTLEEISPAPPPAMKHYFSAFELCNALKPFFTVHLLGLGFEKVIYLDCDLLATGSFEPIWNWMDEASLLLTPHQLVPPALDRPHITEVDIVDMGLFNGGFSAWRRSPAADRMLAWMCSRFPVYGFADRAHGMFADQKLLPLLPEYFPNDVRIVRDARLNIAFWNAHERAVQSAGPGRWTIEGRDVIFFHLSGYRTSRPGVPCTYTPAALNASLLQQCPWLPEVLAAYHAGLIRYEGKHAVRPYIYSHYEGTFLTPEFRRLLFKTGRLDRGSLDYWIIWTREKLRPPKQFVTRVFNRTLARLGLR